MAEKALVVISFGTSYTETCNRTIGAIEKDLTEAFPDRDFYRAWTSSTIRSKLRERDGIAIFSPEEVLDRLLEEGVRDLLIQPTHILAGTEFEKILSALEPKMEQFERVAVGRPLLETKEDAAEFVHVLTGLFAEVKEPDMAVFMGHGSNRIRLPLYDMINEEFAAQGYPNFCVGTVGFEPGMEPVLQSIRRRKPRKVFLSPFLVVAGDHARHDMAGGKPDSWKNRIQAEGAEVDCILKGLGEYPQIRALYVERAKAALRKGKAEGFYFPLFVNLTEKKILVVGAGRVAGRRIRVLSEFAGNITVVAPDATAEVEEMAAAGTIRLLHREFVPDDLAQKDLVLVATDSDERNARIGNLCKTRQIPVNVSSDPAMCDFFFPGVVVNHPFVVGITAGGKDHAGVKQLRQDIQDLLVNDASRMVSEEDCVNSPGTME